MRYLILFLLAGCGAGQAPPDNQFGPSLPVQWCDATTGAGNACPKGKA